MPIHRPLRYMLEDSPSRWVMEKYTGTHFYVFVDESFYRFLDFNDLSGNFCTGIICINAEEYLGFSKAFAELSEAVTSAGGIAGCANHPVEELKYSRLNKLAPSVVEMALEGLASLCRQHGCTISAFFTTVSGYVAEGLRGYSGRAEQLEHLGNIALAAALQEKRAETAASKAEIFSHLLYLPISGLSHYMSSFDCTYQVFLDPRERSEDLEVERMVSSFGEVLKRLPFDVGGGFQGVCASITSERAAGLQAADWVVGAARAWYRANENPLNWNSTFRLITPESEEPIQEFLVVRGLAGKIGHHCCPN